MLPSQLYPQFFLLFAKQTKIEKLHYEFFKSYPKIYKKFYEEKKKKQSKLLFSFAKRCILNYITLYECCGTLSRSIDFPFESGYSWHSYGRNLSLNMH